MIDMFKMRMVNINGCMLGLKSPEGNLFKKPWTLASTFGELIDVFVNCKCDSKHKHQVIQGKSTASTSIYPFDMTDKAIWKNIAYRMSDPDLPPITQSVCTNEDEKDPDGICFDEDRADCAHLEPSDAKITSTHPGAVVEANEGSETLVACPSVGTASIFDVDNYWIFDSGCGHDLVSLAKVKFLKNMFAIAPTKTFSTANGPYETDKVILLNFMMGGQSFVASPYIMANTPSVISMGKKVMEEEFCSFWVKGKDPCVITPYGSVVPLVVEGGVPYLKSSDLKKFGRDHSTCFSARCGVIVEGQTIKITVPIDNQAVAMSGPVQDPDSKPITSSHLGAVVGDDQAEQLKPEEVADPKKDSMAECASDSDDSLDSTVAPETGDEDDNMSVASEDSEVPAKRCLWAVAESIEHKLNHKPALPIHCSECMIAKAKRKRRASRKQSKTAEKFGDIVTCDHVFMKDWFGNKGVDGFPDVFNILDIATRCRYISLFIRKTPSILTLPLIAVRGEPKSNMFILTISLRSNRRSSYSASIGKVANLVFITIMESSNDVTRISWLTLGLYFARRVFLPVFGPMLPHTLPIFTISHVTKKDLLPGI